MVKPLEKKTETVMDTGSIIGFTGGTVEKPCVTLTDVMTMDPEYYCTLSHIMADYFLWYIMVYYGLNNYQHYGSISLA